MIGTILGLALVAGVAQLLRAILVDVSTTDPTVLLIAVACVRHSTFSSLHHRSTYPLLSLAELDFSEPAATLGPLHELERPNRWSSAESRR